MHSWLIFFLGLLPTALLFLLSRFEARGVGPGPMKIMAWTWLLGYSLKSIYLSYAVIYDLPFRPDWLAFYIIDTGQIAILLGTASMMVGYVWADIALNRYSNVTPIPRGLSIDPRLIYFPMVALGLALMLIFFRQMGFIDQILNLRFVATKFFVDEGGQRSSLGFLSIGGDFLTVFFIYYFVMVRKLSWLNIYTLSIALVTVSMFLGSRRNGILAIIILMTIVIAIRRTNTSALKKIARYGGIALVLIAVSFSSQIRGGARDGLTLSQLDVAAAIETTATHAFEGAYFLDPAKTAAIINSINSTDDLLLGTTFVGFIVAPIPRVLWPEKPVIRVGPYIAQELFNFGSQAGVPPGAVGEFYINFGWLGICFGMALVGAFLSYIWWRHRHAEDPRFTLVKYAFIMIAVIYFMTVEFTAACVIFAKFYVAILVAEKYWRSRIYGREPRAQSGHASIA